MAADNRQTSTEALIELQSLQPFGVGGRRLCFEHPRDLSKCIKVLRQDELRTVRSQKKLGWGERLRRPYDNNAHEERELTHLMHRIGPVLGRHLSLCYGRVPTDLGSGLVLDLIRDADGKISRSLRELISTGHDPAEFRSAFEDFGAFLLEHNILTRGLHDHNLAASHQADGSWRLVLIDGVGDPAFLPLASWVPTLGRRKITRRLAAAWSKLEQLHQRGGISAELIASSTWGQGFLYETGKIDNDRKAA